MKKKFRTVVLAIACASLLTACGSESKTSADAPATNGIIVIPNDTKVPEDEAHMQETLTVKDTSGKDYTVNIDVDFEESENPYRRNITSYIMRSPNAAEKEKYVKYMFGEREVYSGDVKDLPREELEIRLEEDKVNLDYYREQLTSNSDPNCNDFYQDSVERLEKEIPLIEEVLPSAVNNYKKIEDYNHDIFISYNENEEFERIEFRSENSYMPNGELVVFYYIFYTKAKEIFNNEVNDEAKIEENIRDILINFGMNEEDIINTTEIESNKDGNFLTAWLNLSLYGDGSSNVVNSHTFTYCENDLCSFELHGSFVLEDNEEKVLLLPVADIKEILLKEFKENSTKYRANNMGALEITSIKLDRYFKKTADESRIELVPTWIVKTSVYGQDIYIDATDGSILPICLVI